MSVIDANYVIAAMAVVFGVLIILGRNRFARSTMEMLRGLKTDITSERLRRFCAVGIALFGAVVIVIGVTIAGTGTEA
jgi:hypothetical protein